MHRTAALGAPLLPVGSRDAIQVLPRLSDGRVADHVAVDVELDFDVARAVDEIHRPVVAARLGERVGCDALRVVLGPLLVAGFPERAAVVVHSCQIAPVYAIADETAADCAATTTTTTATTTTATTTTATTAAVILGREKSGDVYRLGHVLW